MVVPSGADARKIVIDAPEFVPEGSLGPGCTIGESCAATDMPFSITVGGVTTNKAYIYDRGIISFGAEIPTGVDANSDFTSFGVPVIAPLYVPGNTGDPGPYQVSAESVTAGSILFAPTDPYLSSDIFLVNFLDPSTIDSTHNIEGLISVLITASPTQLRFEFLHGMSTLIDSTRFVALPDTAGTRLGYAIDGQTLFEDAPDIEGNNSFTVSLTATPSVPEPATWLAMLLGFGAIGLTFRRNRRSLAPAF